jgi:hypothetical protein
MHRDRGIAIGLKSVICRERVLPVGTRGYDMERGGPRRPRRLSKNGNITGSRSFDVNPACISLSDAGPGQLLPGCNVTQVPLH